MSSIASCQSHAAFLGDGYMAGQAIKLWGFPTELGLLMGMFAGAVLGFVMCVLAFRRGIVGEPAALLRKKQ